MINLMPTKDRKELAAARTNSLLLRYIVLLGIFIGVIVLEMGVVYFLLDTDKRNNEATIADNEAKTVSYAPTKRQADAFRSNLSIAKYILSKQVPYTTLILVVANNLPEGAVLDRLSIDPTTFGESSPLTVKTVSYAKAVEIKSALQKIEINGTPLFSSVSFSSVSKADGSTDTYPFTAIYNITYSKAVLK